MDEKQDLRGMPKDLPPDVYAPIGTWGVDEHGNTVLDLGPGAVGPRYIVGVKPDPKVQKDNPRPNLVIPEKDSQH